MTSRRFQRPCAHHCEEVGNRAVDDFIEPLEDGVKDGVGNLCAEILDSISDGVTDAGNISPRPVKRGFHRPFRGVIRSFHVFLLVHGNIIVHGIGDLLIGCRRRMVAVPIGISSILPNVDFLCERVVPIRRIATKNIAEFEGFGVNFAIRAVDDLQPQRIVVISRSGVDELRFTRSSSSITEGFAAVLCVTDDVAVAEQFFEFLFVKVIALTYRDRPDIQRRGQSEDEAGEQNAGAQRTQTDRAFCTQKY